MGMGGDEVRQMMVRRRIRAWSYEPVTMIAVRAEGVAMAKRSRLEKDSVWF